jgi:hypothetical protein
MRREEETSKTALDRVNHQRKLGKSPNQLRTLYSREKQPVKYRKIRRKNTTSDINHKTNDNF